jgi:endonuclease G
MKKLLITLLLPFGLMAQGLPQKVDIDNQIIEHETYTLSYNETCEQPNWVTYTLKPSDISCNEANRKSYFKTDKLVETGSASHSDYSNSGYDRGHLKPAADESCDQDDMNETFYITNVSPQEPSFNRGIWKKLEENTRNRLSSWDSIVVVTGGILVGDMEVIGKNEVCVPKSFFKVLYLFNDGVVAVEAYLIPNRKCDEPLSSFITPLSELSEKSKLKFYEKVN